MALYIHTIKPAKGSKHSRKLIGRGNASGHGTSSGRGGKGQTARSGGRRGLVLKSFKFLMQSTKKLRGFKSLKEKPAEIYLSDLSKRFNDGEVVNLMTLKERSIINDTAKSAKIVSTGQIEKKLKVEGILCTAQAKEKLLAAGCEIK
ncbi:MAG: 50S ribosomal protein L15 [Patescibacteria group bacterium]